MGIRRFFWSEWGDSVHYGVDPVEPGSSNCPPDSCIELFESPHQKEKSRNSECCFGFSVIGKHFTSLRNGVRVGRFGDKVQ